MKKVWASFIVFLIFLASCSTYEYVADDVYYTPKKRVYLMYDYWYPFNNWYTFSSPYCGMYSPYYNFHFLYYGSYWGFAPYYSSPYYWFYSPYSGNIWQFNYYNYYWYSNDYNSYPAISGKYYGLRTGRTGGTTIPKSGRTGGIKSGTTGGITTSIEKISDNTVKPRTLSLKVHNKPNDDNVQKQRYHKPNQRVIEEKQVYGKPVKVYYSLPEQQPRHPTEYQRKSYTQPRTGTQQVKQKQYTQPTRNMGIRTTSKTYSRPNTTPSRSTRSSGSVNRSKSQNR